MKTGKYTLREFFSNTDLNSIIIPEIQRDYVWGKDQIARLLGSISDDFAAFNCAIPIQQIDSVNSEIIESFNEYYRKHFLSSNIGFIYAYSDADFPGYYFLIDGQQRFTTIFLTLLVIAANMGGDVINSFKRVYTNRESTTKPKLDYRVREASHRFLFKLVESVNSPLSSTWIKDQSWYLHEYDNDTTIKNIVDNIDFIACYLEEKKLVSNHEFMEYVEDYLEFWFFDTNISEQGEELYIYMNARGEFMQDYENLKADLIGKLNDPQQKKNYGSNWETWQDLFWNNRDKNPNADKGFNEFLCCIAGLENFLKEKDRKQYVSSSEEIPYDYKKDILSVETIEKYYCALDRLFCAETIKAFKNKYANVDGSTDWIDKAKAEFWVLLNKEKTNWFADPEDNNRGSERNRMIYVWSMLYYLSAHEDCDSDYIYKTLRLFYIRYHNYDRTVTKTLTSIKTIGNAGKWDDSFLNKGEEYDKYSFLKEKGSLFEEWIWKIEDHPLNLDGRDVGSINCSHLVDFNNLSEATDLEKIHNIFHVIFPTDNDKKQLNNNVLLNSLLFTAFDMEGKPAFWDVDGPGYYTRLNFSSYKRIIRGKSNRGDNEVFKTYFHECLEKNERIQITKNEKEVEEKMDKYSVQVTGIDNILYALCWYAASKGEKIWEKGNFMSFNHQYEKDNYKQDIKFSGITALTNMKGDFRGNDSSQYLQEL